MALPFADRPDIRVRNISFGANAVPSRWWLGGDPFASAFYNALSVTFPQGERFFMDSVRRFKGELPPGLAAEAQAFITQEALHTREHIAFNRLVTDQGYDITALEHRTRRRLNLGRRCSARLQVAITMALEHFTAILAHALLANPAHLEGASDEAKALWRWHAMEEIEHKAVAFDTFLAVHKRFPAPLRWLRRCFVMIVGTLFLIESVSANMRHLLAQDGIKGFRALRGAMHYLWVKPGMLREVGALYLSFFRPGFHPWSHDDRALIQDTDRDLRDLYAVEAAA
jgi:predicted metal-dependent hydrolase